MTAHAAHAAHAWCLIGLTALTAYYVNGLPDIGAVGAVARRPSVTLLATDGTPFATYGDRTRMPVPAGDLPAVLKQAVLATEDRRFYQHFGVDPYGLARAMWVNLRAGRIRQGGSTITQQLAKNLFLTPERTVTRKIQELLLALVLEHRFGKEQILAIYLNRVYLGAGTYGVEAAARRYFGKSARDVGLYEAATLAGLLKAPSRYNPARNPRAARRRTGQVLANMVAAGYLSATRAAAVKPPGGGRRRRMVEESGSRYFADWVMARLGGYIHLGDRDLTVRTTLDLRLQDAAERGAARAVATAGGRQVALLALAPDGAVRAMVGGRDYRQSQFNRATQALRQPGSAFKPFVYLAGIERGLTPDTIFDDVAIAIGGWRPRNYDNKHHGRVTLRQALARSINTVAVQVSERAGRKRVIAAARRLGLTSELKPHPSLALGAGEVTLIELTAAYGAFANGGWMVLPHGIVEVRDSAGKRLYRRSGSGPGRVLDRRTLRAMNDMLGAAIDRGTGKAARLARPAAGKTGTSQDFRDAWFVGYTADMVTGVWLGNDDATPMPGVTGGGPPARLWKDFMTVAHAGKPVRPLPAAGGATPVSKTAPPRPRELAQASHRRSLWERVWGLIGQ